MTPQRDVIFVTGASGFVGRRVVKKLVSQNFAVRALVRQAPARSFDPSVEIVTGDLRRPDTLRAGLEGAAAIVHGALTDDRSADVQLSCGLFELGAQAGVRKFVHLSSIVIYGSPAEGIITEDTPPLPSPDAYSTTKLAIEKELIERRSIPEFCILRLGCVYGAGGGWWTDGLLRLMQRGRLIVVDGGSGIANLIHVDDVAAVVSVLLARSNAPLEIYNVTDGGQVTWSRYYSELEAVLGRPAISAMSASEAVEYGRKWLAPSLARRVIRKLKGASFVHPLEETAVRAFTSRAVYSNDKLVADLGFRPSFEMPEGILNPKD